MESIQRIKRKLKLKRKRTLKRYAPVILIIITIGTVAYFTLKSGTSGPTLKVKVIDSSTGKELQGVNVSVNGMITTTDSKGWASFTLSKGSYTISLQKEGYRSKKYTVTVPLEYKDYVKLDLVSTT